jgi:hypothetical protein
MEFVSKLPGLSDPGLLALGLAPLSPPWETQMLAKGTVGLDCSDLVWRARALLTSRR